MGSGLILLVIVGAWLAVLVPMALRSHDQAASLKSADRFSDAMRVLARRDGAAAAGSRVLLVPRRTNVTASGTTPSRPGPTPAARRLRTLLALVALALVTLTAALAGPRWLLAVHLLVDALLVAFVGHLRRQALRRGARPRRTRPVALPTPPMVAGVPDRMPARPLPLSAALPAPAARYEDPLPAAVTAREIGTGSTWSPVPVPVPTYVGKAVAPSRSRRVVDLTRPGEWTAALEADPYADLVAQQEEDDSRLDAILTRRPAVGDW